jgi:hypothetical protein
MRLVSLRGNSLWAAVLACIIPVTQSRAEEPVCVEYHGLNHCGLAGAGVKKTGSGVKVENHDTSGPGGVIIHTGTTTSWTAGTFIEGVGESQDSKTVLSSVSEGTTTSTAILTQTGGKVAYSATFLRKTGKESTYSLLIYREGILQAAVGGIPSGDVQAVSIPNEALPPIVRPLGMYYDLCISTCIRLSCAYCERYNLNAHRTLPGGVREWELDVANPELHLKDGRVVLGDEIVMREEVPRSERQPSAGFDQIRIQTTAEDIVISDESASNACFNK